ncbi:hypothetical protein [Nonomuraea wenchangensis]|uniref:Uncharacterized protein n=1 Tax=Nonomuraea wenchangensis TaxID=568860 RepID=A0A1I0EVM5_9ACTN|nr:hypothetical protein [Nonomuraea wenchangensis]SET49649.1 hypothetical protein SAMN05421811_103225 [Nonomuraea wenchangensis]
MKVYVATSGYRGDYWYSIQQVFRTREAAEAYGRAHDIEEFELLDAPPEVRDWHTITRTFGKDAGSGEPVHRVDQLDFLGDPDRIEVQVDRNPKDRDRPYKVVVEGWDLDKVKAASEAQCANFLAERNEWAASVVAELDRIDVKVWYEVDGKTVLETPVHRTADHFTVPHDLVCSQLGIDPSQSLHGRWLTVERLSFTEADGFSLCRDPQDHLASSESR